MRNIAIVALSLASALVSAQASAKIAFFNFDNIKDSDFNIGSGNRRYITINGFSFTGANLRIQKSSSGTMGLAASSGDLNLPSNSLIYMFAPSGMVMNFVQATFTKVDQNKVCMTSNPYDYLSSNYFTTCGDFAGRQSIDLSLNGDFSGIRFQQYEYNAANSILIDNLAIDYDVAPAPEPATWALMLAGFGMVGYAMRRKKARVALA